MAYATAEDVAVRWNRTLTEEETALVNARLADVERRIKRRIPDLAAKITAGTVDVEDVKQVEADAVLRLVRNPEGYIQESDGSYSYMLSQEAASGKLEILPEEWESLGWRRRGMFQIVPTIVMPT
ncbi:Gp19/Gp15/Gp42 family protein [Nocardia abscessus]|uniref:Gp19/Gp15/Gp42 family protein n=1 Tax=Nocardia abscessus TaxID=120957 RepID=UPI0024560CCC|nr:Gp19/Gp15/Gp42 family protein [Nocardia abscessus]